MKVSLLCSLMIVSSFSWLAGQGVGNAVDSLSHVSHARADSLIANLGLRKDSIQDKLNFKLDSTVNRFNAGLESLKKATLRPDTYVKKLDSAYAHFQGRTLNGLSKKYDSLDQSAQNKISNLNNSISAKRRLLDSLRLKSESVGIGNKFVLDTKFEAKLPEFEFTGTNIPSTEKIPSVNVPSMEGLTSPNLSTTKSLNGLKLPEIKGLDMLKEVQSYSSKIGELTKKASDIKGVDGKINKEQVVKTAESEIERQVSQVDGVGQLKTQSQTIETLKQKSDALKEMDEKALKANVKKEFIDHFAGKEAILQKDMSNLAKIQMKYRDVADSRFLPKRPPNELKGKPFVERLVPGLSWQIYRYDKMQIDLSAFIAYRLTRNNRVGISGFHRFVFTEKNNPLSIKEVDILGFRFFSNFRLFNKLNTYLEYEKYRSSSVPANNISHTLAPERDLIWKDRLNLGLTRNFRLSKNLTGNMVMMQNILEVKELFNPKHSSVRFGLEYRIKKKKKQVN